MCFDTKKIELVPKSNVMHHNHVLKISNYYYPSSNNIEKILNTHSSNYGGIIQ